MLGNKKIYMHTTEEMQGRERGHFGTDTGNNVRNNSYSREECPVGKWETGSTGSMLFTRIALAVDWMLTGHWGPELNMFK
jgi:hypothetical protein